MIATRSDLWRRIDHQVAQNERLRKECDRLRLELAEANNSLTHARELLDLERAAAERPALFSVREAMREAGVPGWEDGSGVSSAEAVRMIAAERDAAIALAKQSYVDGRTAERADVVDWIRHPPGRVPEGARSTLEELWRSIVAGMHDDQHNNDSWAIKRFVGLGGKPVVDWRARADAAERALAEKQVSGRADPGGGIDATS